MPLTKDITFKCPECGEEIPLTLWQSVNTAENPKEAEALAYGDLFYIQCPKCGYQTMANYSLLYHDVEHGMMIQYIATPDREERAKEMAEYRKARKESIEAAKAQDPALAKQLYGSVFRFVTSLNDLREKALILRAGLDDRYVELVKAYIMPQAANMNPCGSSSIRTGSSTSTSSIRTGRKRAPATSIWSPTTRSRTDSHSLRRTPISLTPAGPAK